MRTLVRRLSLVVVVALAADPSASATERGSKPAAPRITARRPVDPGRVAVRTDRALGATAGPRSRALSPSNAFGFDAIPRIGRNFPADPSGALGTTYFLTAVNTSYAVYDRTGTSVLGPSPLRGLLGFPARTQLFDPKVVYDQYAETFVLAYLAINDSLRRSWIVVTAIPEATATDPTTWCASRIGGDRTSGDGRQWSDYPGLGFDLDRVVVTTNQFDFAAPQPFRGAQILSFPKASLYDCGAALAFDTITARSLRTPEGFQAFTLQPAVTVGAAPTAQYLLSFRKTGPSTSALTLWRLRDVGGVLALAKASLQTGRVRAPYPGTQGGGDLDVVNTYWDVGDLRLINAYYDADRNLVYAAHTVFRDLKPDTGGRYEESVIQWFEVQPADPLSGSTLTRTGVVGEVETDAGWPVVATDGAGNLFVSYSRASSVTGEYLSAWAAEIVPGSTDAATTLLVQGTARFEAMPGIERWGDFNGISRDPADPSRIVMVNQYAVSDGSGTTMDWQQVVNVVTHV